MPFMTEEIYRNLVCSIVPDAPVSVHMCGFPDGGRKRYSTPRWKQQMRDLVEVVVLGRSCRNRERRP